MKRKWKVFLVIFVILGMTIILNLPSSQEFLFSVLKFEPKVRLWGAPSSLGIGEKGTLKLRIVTSGGKIRNLCLKNLPLELEVINRKTENDKVMLESSVEPNKEKLLTVIVMPTLSTGPTNLTLRLLVSYENSYGQLKEIALPEIFLSIKVPDQIIPLIENMSDKEIKELQILLKNAPEEYIELLNSPKYLGKTNKIFFESLLSYIRTPSETAWASSIPNDLLYHYTIPLVFNWEYTLETGCNYDYQWRSLIQNKTKEIIKGEQDSYQAALLLCNWVFNNIPYDITYDPKKTMIVSPPAQEQGPLEILEIKTGVCRHKAMLLAAFYRSIGLPARIIHIQEGKHAAVQVYILERGWVPVDPTAHLFDVHSPCLGPFSHFWKAWALDSLVSTGEDVTAYYSLDGFEAYLSLAEDLPNVNSSLLSQAKQLLAEIKTLSEERNYEKAQSVYMRARELLPPLFENAPLSKVTLLNANNSNPFSFAEVRAWRYPLGLFPELRQVRLPGGGIATTQQSLKKSDKNGIIYLPPGYYYFHILGDLWCGEVKEQLVRPNEEVIIQIAPLQHCPQRARELPIRVMDSESEEEIPVTIDIIDADTNETLNHLEVLNPTEYPVKPAVSCFRQPYQRRNIYITAYSPAYKNGKTSTFSMHAIWEITEPITLKLSKEISLITEIQPFQTG